MNTKTIDKKKISGKKVRKIKR